TRAWVLSSGSVGRDVSDHPGRWVDTQVRDLAVRGVVGRPGSGITAITHDGEPAPGRGGGRRRGVATVAHRSCRR
ncbi:MAG TPA: hypothetical protein VE152_11620, partial [Acidimicrobiales bacterium]|nr:hypothetical protein [Acidimicrobiales bacterium]